MHAACLLRDEVMIEIPDDIELELVRQAYGKA